MNVTQETLRRAQLGFTLVEVIIVIVVMGILGAIAMPKFFESRVFSERGYYEELATSLRFSRIAAVTTGCPVRVAVSASSFQAEQQQPLNGRCNPADTAWGQAVSLADGSPVAGSAPSGVVASPAVTFVFNTLGGTNLGSDRTITVGPYSLTIDADSGYVETD